MSEIYNALDILRRLKDAGYDDFEHPYWWPGAGSFEVIMGAILTQNTRWERVEESLAQLKAKGLDTLDAVANADTGILQECIRRSGFYKSKSKYLQGVCRAIKQEYGDFDTFAVEVDRQWLLSQKGLGEESTDAILNYACFQEYFVVDRYTQRMLHTIGFEFDSYGEIQSWMQNGLKRYGEIYPDMERAQLYARFHGMIVECAKKDKKFTLFQTG